MEMPHFNKSIINKIVDSGLFKFRKEFGKLDKSYECSFVHKETKTPIDIFIFYKIKDDLYLHLHILVSVIKKKRDFVNGGDI